MTTAQFWSHWSWPLATAVIGAIFTALLIHQYTARRGPHQLAWAIGFFIYAAAAFMEAWSQHKAMFRPSLIINGRVAGLWKRRLSKTSVHIAVQRLRKLSEVETTALELAAERYANFLGKTAVLQ